MGGALAEAELPRQGAQVISEPDSATSFSNSNAF
jgi:hypothetical protein